MLFILSPSKVSLSLPRRSRIFFTCFSFISSFLYSCKARRRPTSDSIALAPAQPPFSSSLPRGLRIQMHRQTIITDCGGCAKDLISVIDALSNSSRALAAASSAGRAACRASSASAFSRSMMMLSFAICSAAALASSWRFVATMVFSLMSSMSARTFSAFSSTMIFLASSSTDISVTCCAACTSLSRPPPRRPCIVSRFLRFMSRNFM
mmetsp:Transcript_149591/g.480094  ORF Transcript_149591/g.480094 Transcript_149591/m.480094 type:complete len:208 (+) Transcript_149591:3749-4372(+)